MTEIVNDSRWAILDPKVWPQEPEEYLRTAIRWHFGEETGSPFWLRRAKTLDFDPVTDVRGYDDLRRFPNVVDETRDLPVEDLIPRGYGPNPPAPRVFESGGTTGVPKRIILMPDWLDAATDRMIAGPQFAGREPGNILVAVPGGPHKAGSLYDEVVKRQNTIKFTIDIDPRWIKKLVKDGQDEQVAAYTEHILDQIEHVLSTQRVSMMVITPPLLRACSGRQRLAALINDKLELIFWGGAHMTIDQRFEMAHMHFPNVRLLSRYSSAMILVGARERQGTGYDDLIFDPPSPVVTFRVVDMTTGEPVEYGRRGQVVMNHVSKGMFLPNNAERDSAIRIPGLPGQIGDSVSSPAPVNEFGGERVIEGLY